MKWKELSSVAAWQAACERSCELPVIIFKHSTRCSVSVMAKRNVESSWEYNPDEAEVYLLDLLSHREISNEIANYSGVKHESPQLILLKNKLAVHHASHSDINTENLRQFLNRTV